MPTMRRRTVAGEAALLLAMRSRVRSSRRRRSRPSSRKAAAPACDRLCNDLAVSDCMAMRGGSSTAHTRQRQPIDERNRIFGESLMEFYRVLFYPAPMIRSCLPVLRRHFLLASTCLVASGGFTVATAGVTGFSGQGGTISQPNPRTTIIHQTADKAIFNVASFDIGRGESITFQQPNAGSIALTRVQGGAASQIDGALTANGRVWIVNPFGVIFGANAVVNVGGLLAATADIR